ncbi:hypothetical protein T484DRAFT_1973996 [Baffinella frigidus]|nr:hypothetical protein T484DRAFT_1973996 [Cryptophyta sp. CCMP2293]
MPICLKLKMALFPRKHPRTGPRAPCVRNTIPITMCPARPRQVTSGNFRTRRFVN